MRRPIFENKLLNPSAISALSVYVWLLILNESGKDDLSFVFPIAYFSIDQHFLELFLFSSRYVLKYIFFIFHFNLLKILLYILYLVIFSTVGFRNFIDHIFSLLIDEVSRPGVNQGSLLINLDRDDVSRNGKDVSNSTRYNSINYQCLHEVQCSAYTSFLR